jgi:hypothetical protein
MSVQIELQLQAPPVSMSVQIQRQLRAQPVSMPVPMSMQLTTRSELAGARPWFVEPEQTCAPAIPMAV